MNRRNHNTRLRRLLRSAIPALILAGGPPAAGEPPMPTVDEQIVMLYYKEIDAPAAFYGETLGFEKTFDQPWAKIFRVSETSSVGVISEGQGAYHKAQPTNAVMLSIVTREVDAWYQRILAARDVRILKEIQNNESAPIRAFLIEDPGGYTVEFFQWLEKDE